MNNLRHEKPFERMLSFFFKRCPKSGRITGLNKSNKFVRYCIPLTGLLALVWFLLRVLPKPSRATYPCMQVVTPLASGFVTWILGVGASIFAFRKAQQNFGKARFVMGTLCTLLAVFAVIGTVSYNAVKTYAGRTGFTNAVHPGLNPIGSGVGINPGRVVWVHDPDATNENCTNNFGDGYFLPKNNNLEVISRMLDNSVKGLTGESTVSDAWDAIFRFHNLKRNNTSIGYTPGELVFIKINSVSSWVGNLDPATFQITNHANYGTTETSPAVVTALLRELVNSYGVRQEDIIIGDPCRDLYRHATDLWRSEFPNVKILGKSTANNHTMRVRTSGQKIFYSDRGTILREGTNSDYTAGPPLTADYMWTVFENAKYIINVPAMKAHNRGGISLTAKNHFGSMWQSQDNATRLHGGLVNPDDENVPDRTGMGLYRVLVDLMGHELLGGKTVLYLVDGLWAGSEAIDPPRRFQSAPFNGDWTSSLFLSQDPVAIESVCFDFLRTEFNASNPFSSAPQMIGVDDHLEQAADPSRWPSNITYDPENDGTPLTSLGVQEHWNNADLKQYSKNINPSGNGIELLKINNTNPTTSFAVNCGGNSYTAADGTVYQADRNYTGGTVATNSNSITATSDQVLYQSERWGACNYAVSGMVNGSYTIKFHFTETYFNSSASRRFDVVVEGQTVITQLDIFAQVGQNRAYDVTKTVNVTDGTLNISFTNATANNPKICAFVVRPAGNQAPVASAGIDRTVNPNSLITLNGLSSTDPDNGPSPLSHSWICLTNNATLTGPYSSQPTFTCGAAGTIYTFRLTVNDGELSSTDDITITVGNNSTEINLPGIIEAENYRIGGEGKGYHDLTYGNSGGAHKPDDNVDIENCSDAGNGYNIGWTQPGEWLAYDVNVQATGTYKLTARMASGASGTKTMTMTVDDNLVGTFSFNDASGWQSWNSVTSPNINLTAGSHTVYFTMSTGGINLNYVDVASVSTNPGSLQFSAATCSINESDPSITITVNRVNGSSGSVSVNYATSNNTAIAGSDYSARSGTLTFPAGVTVQTFTVPIINDVTAETSETVNLTLSNPAGGATLGTPTSAVLTIIDNDVPLYGSLQFSAATYSVNESDPSVTITVNRVNGSSGSVSVNYATSNNTAIAGSDYSARSGVLTFPAGVTVQTFTVPIINDVTSESSETVNLTLSNPTGGATLGTPAGAVLTIIDNELSGIPLPGRMEAENYWGGGEGVGYHDLTPNNTGGACKPDDNVDIEVTNDVNGGEYNVGWTDNGEWLAYDVDVLQTGIYKMSARCASGLSGVKTLTITIDGDPLTTISTSVNNNWQTYTDAVSSNFNLDAGRHIIRVTTSGGLNLNYFDVATSTTSNLVTNGEFSNNGTGWTAGGTSFGTVSYASANADWTITGASGQIWEPQLVQGVSIVGGTQYTISFNIRTDESDRTIEVHVNGNSDDNYVNRGLSQVVPVTTSWQPRSYTFTANATDATARLDFNLGSNANDVIIDDVKLIMN